MNYDALMLRQRILFIVVITTRYNTNIKREERNDEKLSRYLEIDGTIIKLRKLNVNLVRAFKMGTYQQ